MPTRRRPDDHAAVPRRVHGSPLWWSIVVHCGPLWSIVLWPHPLRACVCLPRVYRWTSSSSRRTCVRSPRRCVPSAPRSTPRCAWRSCSASSCSSRTSRVSISSSPSMLSTRTSRSSSASLAGGSPTYKHPHPLRSTRPLLPRHVSPRHAACRRGVPTWFVCVRQALEETHAGFHPQWGQLFKAGHQNSRWAQQVPWDPTITEPHGTPPSLNPMGPHPH
jgi:hypothetical protein